VDPHAVASVSFAHPEPQAWLPVLQVNPQVPAALQVASLARVGTGHGVHDAPHEFTSVDERHSPLHACVPFGQLPLQAVALSMQAPLQSFLSVGQLPPQDVPSHVAVPPPVGATHGVQETPQVRGSSLSTQVPPQSCWPEGQAGWASAPSGAASTTWSAFPSEPPPPSARVSAEPSPEPPPAG
jgi:hypothetical protein